MRKHHFFPGMTLLNLVVLGALFGGTEDTVARELPGVPAKPAMAACVTDYRTSRLVGARKIST